MHDSEHFQRRFIDTVLDPDAWEHAAETLLRSALTLEPRAQESLSHPEGVYLAPTSDGPVAVYFMLCAFAVENFLKARIIRSKSDEFRAQLESSTKLPSQISTHNLSALARRSGKQGLADGFANILERLTRSAVWYGRYPAPTHPDFLNRFTTAENGELISRTMYASDDINEVHRVFRELGVSLDD